jgi:predicted phosphoribosyltransferase
VKEFAGLTDAGRQLGAQLEPRIGAWVTPTLLPVLPNGVPVAAGIRDVCALPWLALTVERGEEGVVVPHLEGLEGVTAIVVDDGVETGTVVRAVAPVLRQSGVSRLVLAVPVCSREAMADLGLRYDEIVAVATPLVRRSLAWHYVDFDTIDEQEALRLLAES